MERAIIVSMLAILPMAGHTNERVAVDDRCDGIEYRLVTTPDEPGSEDVAWWDGTITRRLAGDAFLNASHFRSAKLRPSPPLPGKWDIELSHTANGGKIYAAVGNADRDRRVSIVVGGKIVQSFAFPPMQKDINVGGTSAGAFPKDVGEQLLLEIREAIGACAGK